jgi:hypothetical protein
MSVSHYYIYYILLLSSLQVQILRVKDIEGFIEAGTTATQRQKVNVSAVCTS